MDPNTLFTTMVAGATIVGPKIGEIVGTEIVKEATKDAYKKLKSTLAAVCGRKVEYAANNVEADPSSDAARTKLAESIGEIPEPDIAEVSAALQGLQEALKANPEALAAAEATAGIKLDIISGRNVMIERIEGAKSIEVKSRSEQDFTFRDVKMAGDPEGN